MRVLITGAAGQVGSHVADMLLARGDEVVGIDNFATGRRVHLPSSDGFRLFEGHIADASLVNSAVETFGPDVVVHAAASYRDPDDWLEDVRTNTQGGAQVIQASVRAQVPRFIYFQTALVYGTQPKESPITLNHPRFVANSSYAISKGACEDYLALSSLSYVSFRLANVIGDRCVSGPLPIFFQRLRSGRKCYVTPARRDFVYVGDLARAVVSAIDGVGSGPYHFSSGADFAIRELYDAVAHALDLADIPTPDEVPLGDDEAPSILLDPSRTIEDFGPMQLTSLQETVRRAVEYYKTHGTNGELTHLRREST